MPSNASTPASPPPAPPELRRAACTFAEQLLRAHSGKSAQIVAEAASHNWLWSQFRHLYKQHTRVWQELTVVTLGLDATGTPVGWVVEKRKESCLHQVLPDDQVERRARELRQVRLDMKVQRIERRAIDDHRSFAVVRMGVPADPKSSVDVFVNHTTGEVMGVLPALTEKSSPVPADDPLAQRAHELAWQQVEHDLRRRVGPDAVTHSREVLRLTALNAVRDQAGRSIHKYMLWSLITTCDVTVEENTKEVVAWYCPAFQDEAPESRLTEDLARQRAAPELKSAPGAQGPSVTLAESGGLHKATVHWWHVENGVPIEGDQVTVLINAWDGRVYSVARKWRKVAPQVFAGKSISEADAIRAADRALDRPSTETPGAIIGKSVIEIAMAPDDHGPGQDVLVWRVGYDGPAPGAFTEVAIHHESAKVVRITGW